ncbi:MAG: ABC transporter substrate-binding protein [Lachnospiraceae bacterium]|nr:ABC transporter substrate-binding protein [Lachnospiraceae bacterium]
MLSVTSCSTQGVTSDNRENDNRENISRENNVSEDEGLQQVDITLEGGSGRAHIESPVTVVTKNGETFATLIWSSQNYDYVLVDGIKYINENPGGPSTFTVPVGSLDEPFTFIADTTAMSKPHEIEYTITWGQTQDEPLEVESRSGFGKKPDDYTEPVLKGYEPAGEIPLERAQGFTMKQFCNGATHRYENVTLISIYGVGEYLLVPEGQDLPGSLPKDITVIKQPVDSTYLVSTSVMDLVRQIGALDSVKLSGLEADDWHIKEAAERINDGRMEYAGKYRAPDYELILKNGCNLAIENTMIFHDPEVKEKLEELGIPVLVETSSYEKDPLARLEWIKLYGLIFDRQEEAEEFYNSESKKIEEALNGESSGKSLAFFSISATGMVNVRTPDDYMATMIGMAGFTYVPGKDSYKNDVSTATVNMQMEDFFAAAKDADILIYNSTIQGEIGSVSDLIAENELFSEFRAVKEGNVYCLSGDYFQKTTGAADFLLDLKALGEGSERDYTFLKKLGD